MKPRRVTWSYGVLIPVANVIDSGAGLPADSALAEWPMLGAGRIVGVYATAALTSGVLSSALGNTALITGLAFGSTGGVLPVDIPFEGRTPPRITANAAANVAVGLIIEVD